MTCTHAKILQLTFPRLVHIANEESKKNCYIWHATCIDNESIQKAIVPGTVSAIPAHAFLFCKNLISIYIPEGIKSIGTESFLYCGKLDNLVIPASVEYIGNAFNKCDGLHTIAILRKEPPRLFDELVLNRAPITSILVPEESVELYQKAWPEYKDIISPVTRDFINGHYKKEGLSL